MAVNSFVSYWQRALAEVNSCKLRHWRAGLVGIVRSALLPTGIFWHALFSIYRFLLQCTFGQKGA